MRSSNSFIILFFLLVSLSTAQTPLCGKGSFLKDGKCVLCPEGTYQDVKNSTSCQKCPHGTFNPYKGAQGVDICIDCPAGTFQANQGAKSQEDCKACPSGENAPPGAPSCRSCPAGSMISLCEKSTLPEDWTISFRGTCYNCFFTNVGTFCENNGSTNTTCLECAPDETSDKNDLHCTLCPSGSLRSPGSSTCDTACPPGSFKNEYGYCSECFLSMFNDGSTSRCEYCPPGYTGNKVRGSTKCLQCPSDSYKNASNGRCEKCSPGQTSEKTAGALCLPKDVGCPSKFFKDEKGICRTCPLQTRLDEETRTCIPCPRNHLSPGGVTTSCTACPTGMISSDKLRDFRDLHCHCKPGYGFIKNSNGLKCEKCPPGSESDGRISCKKCSPDTFAAKSGSSKCISCPNGQGQPRVGATSCTPTKTVKCGKGQIKSPGGICVLPGTGCPPESARKPGPLIYDAFTCNPSKCPSGTVLKKYFEYSNRETYTFCDVCGKYERFDGKNSCRPCKNDEYSKGGLYRKCHKCPQGQIFSHTFDDCRCLPRREMKNGKCLECPPGTMGYYDIEGCMQCPAGMFSNGFGSSSCSECPPGTFSDKPGSKECTPCPPGKTSFGGGNTKCS